MKLRHGILAGLMLLGLGGTALAADKGGAELADAFTPSADRPWSGCWGAANLGYGMQTSQYTAFDGFTNTSLEEAAKDVSYGVGIGCDVQAGNFVLGAMADMDWTRADGNVAAWDSQWAASARAGYLLMPKTLIYGLIGYTKLDGGFVFDQFATTFTTDFRGLTLGGGIEQMLAGGWAIKAEYRWVDLGDATTPVAIDGLADGTKVDNNLHQVRLGLVYRFGAAK